MEIKQKKGISLIVLVITIIVMIILAAAIILSLNSSGIIGKANQATTESNTANKKEAASIALAEYELKKQLGELTEGETATSYVQKVLKDQGIDADDVIITENGTIVIASNINIPIGATVTGYILTEKSYTTDGSEHNGEGQTLKTDIGLTWKYIGKDEDGNMLIAADMSEEIPVDSQIELGYEGGYLNGPQMLDKVCNELYSTSKGTARSMNINDVNNLLNYEGPKGCYYDTEYNEITTPEPLTIGEIATKLGTELSNVKTPDGANTWETLSKYKSNWYYIEKTSNDIKNEAGKDLVFYNEVYYWLASSCVDVDFSNSVVDFRIYYVCESDIFADVSFYSDGEGTPNSYVIRPVVSLNSDIQFTYDSVTNICTLR